MGNERGRSLSGRRPRSRRAAAPVGPSGPSTTPLRDHLIAHRGTFTSSTGVHIAGRLCYNACRQIEQARHCWESPSKDIRSTKPGDKIPKQWARLYPLGLGESPGPKEVVAGTSRIGFD